MKATMSMLVIAAPTLAGTLALAVSAPQTSTREIMQDKLGRAQQILGAIVRDDLQEVEEQAEALRQLAELQSWYVLPTPDYAQHSSAFRDAVRALSAAARRDEPDAALESYFAAVRECAACHEYMRRARGAEPRAPVR